MSGTRVEFSRPADGTSADRSGARATVLIAFVAVLSSEALVALDPLVGAGAHTLVLLALLLRWIRAGEAAVLVLALLPLGRLSALALTPGDYVAATYVLTGLPLLLAVLWAWRWGGGPHIRASGPPELHAIAVALSGIPLGFWAHGLLDLPVLPDGQALWTVIVAGLLVFLFAGVLEELLFRGLLQTAMQGLFGRWAIVLAGVLFAAAYLPVRDAGVLAWMAVVGLAFGWYVQGTTLTRRGRHRRSRTPGLMPVAVAHGFMAAGALVVWPALA